MLPRPVGWARWLMAIYGLLLIGIGLALALPGTRLAMLGGSTYYLIAGLATIASGIVLVRGRWQGAWIFAGVLAGTLGWAFREVGLDGWALVPRLVAPFVLGIPLGLGLLLAAFPQRRLTIGIGTLASIGLLALAILAMREKIETPGDAPLTDGGSAPAAQDWAYYGNDAGGSRHSSLAQINSRNVSGLKLAWSTHVDQVFSPGNSAMRLEVTPLKIGNLVYACTDLDDVFALDADSGTIRWHFQSHDDTPKPKTKIGTCRGLTYYQVPGATGICARRIYKADTRLIALDALTGRICAGFGANGQVDLLHQIGLTTPGYYTATSPPQLVRGKLVVNAFIPDGQSLGEPSGVIRAFDAVTGKLAWAWDMARPDRHGAPPLGETYTRGTPNSWAPISADETLGLVYVPTGNATPDYFGAHRKPAMERYSSSLVALDAATGELRWNFQFIHHDLWDYDVSVQPVLIDLPTPEGTVAAVAQATKSGQLFVLDRRTGKPVFQVRERPVPQGAVKGDWVSATQPHSALPDFVGPRLTERDMWGTTPLDQLWCRIRFREARYDGPFTPVGVEKPTIVTPGFSGGIEWGSSSYDPQRHLLLLISNYIVNYDQLVPRSEMTAEDSQPSRDPRTIDYSRVPQKGVPYGARTPPFIGPAGAPCTRPPFSRLNAIDLRTGKLAWSRPLGTARALGAYGIQSGLPIRIGTPSFGGSMTTAGGLTFVGASLDHSLRAFETSTGRLLWRGNLPSNGLATPMTYSTADGRQMVVIAAGDPPNPAKPNVAGGTIVAFALPSTD